MVFKGKRIGEIRNKTFLTHRGPEHFFRKFNGFGMSEEVYKLLLKQGVYEVVIVYKDEYRRVTQYHCFLPDFEYDGIVYLDQGEDKQFVLSIDKMESWEGEHDP